MRPEALQAGDYAGFRAALAASDCRLCGLCSGRTNIVVDRGNPESRALFIGEAPGATEDAQGRAFVGRAGRLLDELLAAAGFNTEKDALIANVVKCRPPGNRPPTPEEASRCLPFLRRQIEFVRPGLIGLLGNTAARHILPHQDGLSMGERVGRLFSDPGFPGVEMMVFYHPAYILRDPRKKPVMQSHLKIFVDRWRAMLQSSLNKTESKL